MNRNHPFEQVARLPAAGDNAAIAVKRLESGSPIDYQGQRLVLSHTVLEGHRFAVREIQKGQPLLSWGQPFGLALSDIEPGAYVCNVSMLEALQLRRLQADLPSEPNFADVIRPYILDNGQARFAEQVSRVEQVPSFAGFQRGPARGVGTRNYIVLLGTSSLTSGYVRQLEIRLKDSVRGLRNLDGIVAVAHTEGGSGRPNNLEMVLRTLAGFVVHPNIGAILAVDYGHEPVNNERLENYMRENGYPLAAVRHRFMSLTDSFEAGLAQGEVIVRDWLGAVNALRRTEESADSLRIALQCGGSDAFSGVSGNPLAAWAAREFIRFRGRANLAETPELIGAEAYVLQRVKDADTARRFLALIERFKERVAWHGVTAEANPSGGNKFRGLYNISLKSLGAAMKRHPEVRLDQVIEYSERMQEPGYYFMDSPGHDLESVAGQVASGCNLILFVTGNGSVTNFPFVPTIKIVTTSRRHQLLPEEMDFNAGAYLDGRSMDELGQELVQQALRVVSGARSSGERAGHTQVQIWRNWRQVDDSKLGALRHQPKPTGKSLSTMPGARRLDVSFQAMRTERGVATDFVGLIVPTSLCAGQIARIAAERLNRKRLGRDKGLSRFVSLVHTEGCATSNGLQDVLSARVLLNYLDHPFVACGLLLEHGCEVTHNDFMRRQLERKGADAESLGWVSVQLDGGMRKVMRKIDDWFEAKIATLGPPRFESVGLEALRLGLVAVGPIMPDVAASLAQLSRMVVGSGGTVVIAQSSSLLSMSDFLDGLNVEQDANPSLAYGQFASASGLHVMEMPTDHLVETVTGLGASGIELILVCSDSRPVQGHPLVPVLQIRSENAVRETGVQLSRLTEVDLLLRGGAGQWAEQMLNSILDVVSRRYRPKASGLGNTDFQITRGLLGVSL